MADLTSIRNSYVAAQPSRVGVPKAALYSWLSWIIPRVVVLL